MGRQGVTEQGFQIANQGEQFMPQLLEWNLMFVLNRLSVNAQDEKHICNKRKHSISLPDGL